MAHKHVRRCWTPQEENGSDETAMQSCSPCIRLAGIERCWGGASIGFLPLLGKCKLGTLFLERNLSISTKALYVCVSFDVINSAFENLFYKTTGRSEQR